MSASRLRDVFSEWQRRSVHACSLELAAASLMMLPPALPLRYSICLWSRRISNHKAWRRIRTCHRLTLAFRKWNALALIYNRQIIAVHSWVRLACRKVLSHWLWRTLSLAADATLTAKWRHAALRRAQLQSQDALERWLEHLLLTWRLLDGQLLLLVPAGAKSALRERRRAVTAWAALQRMHDAS